ncbi:MAG: alpha-ketoglutaric semialdehyde dehydrogenase [Flavobacteriaceae bacterium]|jgi:alpha-ketoglutaric semialdehyde dehydrogenase|uniref:aldehyde dehydrogenase (NADP(+)) n=1 Tax=Candidatus Marifrigoribacter sp. Uisw_064 TaxID=3230970 RepID=UPI003AEC9CE3
MTTGENHIGNQRSAKGTKTYKTFNPLLNIENDQVFYEATSEEINQAVDLASDAFKVFSKKSPKEKAIFLRAITEEILAMGDDLIAMYQSETGLPEGRAKGERGRTIGQLISFADMLEDGNWVEATIDTADLDRAPIPKQDIRKMLIPLGPVVVFGASNFPFAYSTAGGDTASALAAGCPVICKSHPMHAGTSEMVSEAINRAAIKTGMPTGVFSNLNSSGIEVGVELVKHPGVKAVGFTGSIKGGRALYNIASERPEPIPVFAEMGSVNPVVLLPEAIQKRGEALAKTYAGSITLGTGQFCTNPGLLIGIKSDGFSTFIDTLSSEIIKISPSCMLHPNIIGNYERNKENALQQNGLLVTADYTDEVSTNYARQTIVTVEGATFLENTTLHQEVFGPFSMVVQCKDAHELETIIQQLEGQLTGTILAEQEELAKYSSIVDALQNRVGRIIFNGVPTGVEVCPAMLHGGPYPSSTDSRFTAVGLHAVKRWVRPFSFQSWPNSLLPDELKDENPLEILRLVNGNNTKSKI